MSKDYSAIEGARRDFAKDCYDKGYEQGCIDAYDSAEHSGYVKGLNDAWECARKIVQLLKCRDINEIFGDRDEVGRKMIFEEFTASEAIAKIKEWETIKAGDEVICDEIKGKGVVTRIDYKNLDILTATGDIWNCVDITKCQKTGRYFSEIPKVLKQMGGEE